MPQEKMLEIETLDLAEIFRQGIGDTREVAAPSQPAIPLSGLGGGDGLLLRRSPPEGESAHNIIPYLPMKVGRSFALNAS
jgi:hypothetical protein